MYVGSALDIGAVMRERRKEKGWSQQDLAEAMGATRQWVISVENGSSRAQLDMVLTALKQLDLGINVFHDTSADELDELIGDTQ
ncbi:MAG: helix-turn-helix domain-containing protein [Ancrocorticia sp.]|uniref:helix-turn-helix domain-containing protein n=1 Tax=Ancrocorticia sp. TaxID=2593684 RepID=UPI003F920225